MIRGDTTTNQGKRRFRSVPPFPRVDPEETVHAPDVARDPLANQSSLLLHAFYDIIRQHSNSHYDLVLLFDDSGSIVTTLQSFNLHFMVDFPQEPVACHGKHHFSAWIATSLHPALFRALFCILLVIYQVWRLARFRQTL